MERGEVEALSMPWTVFRVIRADWLRDKKVNVLLQTGLDKAPDLPGVPRASSGPSRATATSGRSTRIVFAAGKLGRALTAPPGVPPRSAWRNCARVRPC